MRNGGQETGGQPRVPRFRTQARASPCPCSALDGPRGFQHAVASVPPAVLDRSPQKRIRCFRRLCGEQAGLLPLSSADRCDGPRPGELPHTGQIFAAADVLANDFRLINELIKEDFPTFDFPANANSGKLFSGKILVIPQTVSSDTLFIFMFYFLSH